MQPTNQIKVLLVEDDDFIARMYKAKLTIAGLAVTIAVDGQAGIDLALQVLPDIILLDIMLPKLNGWEVLELLKQHESTKAIPVILLTNIGTPEDVKHGLALGAVDYMIKAHFIPDEIVDKIHSTLKQPVK